MLFCTFIKKEKNAALFDAFYSFEISGEQTKSQLSIQGFVVVTLETETSKIYQLFVKGMKINCLTYYQVQSQSLHQPKI